jgi:leader peptidase (prepilin peptidase)/N-methyltransferase
MSELAWVLASVAFGLAVGSFLNVVIHRLPLMMAWAETELEDEKTSSPSPDPSGSAGVSVPPTTQRLSLAFPGSHCPKCSHPITALRNIPVISYCLLAGACSACGERIAARYPIVELLGGLTGLVCMIVFGPSPQALSAMVFIWFAIAMSCIDWEHLLVPDVLSLSLLWVGLAFNAFNVHVAPSDAILGAVGGYAAFWIVDAVAARILGRTAIGQGDFKLFAAIGAWFGWQALAPSLLVASATGVLVGYGLIWAGVSKKGQPICFAPFLFFGATMVLFAGDRLQTWLSGPWGI